MILSECVLGCKKIDGGNVITKNRDRTYDATVVLIHHNDANLEYVIIFDPKTHYIEGYNATTGIAIMNVALANGADFSGSSSMEGVNIFRALLNAKTLQDAAEIITTKGQEVFGTTMVADANDMITVEFIDGQKKVTNHTDLDKIPIVRTNHGEAVPNTGYIPSHGDDYISSKTRQAFAEVIFDGANNCEEIMDGLNYPFFGTHSGYDANRQTPAMRTCSQMGMDLANNDIYFRVVPGHGHLKGIVKSGDWSRPPKIKIHNIDYNEPLSDPTESWQADPNYVHESINLARHLNPDDDYDCADKMEDIEIAAIKERKPLENVDHYIDKSNEIISMLVSLQNLLRKSDSSIQHLTKDRDTAEDDSFLSSIIQDAESSAMELYDLRSLLKGKNATVTEAKRKPRKKGQHRNSPSHSDLYTDENPKGTIKGLKFATKKDAQKSVAKIKKSGRSHNHKTQAAIAMEQRAKAAGKKSSAAVYRKFIEQQKKKTKAKNEAVATRENLFLDRPSKSRGYMSGDDKNWQGENTSDLIYNYLRSMGMIKESRFKQMVRKPRFTDLRGYLTGADFIYADAEADYDENDVAVSEAQLLAQKYIQAYFDKRFGKDKIKLNVDVSSNLIHPKSSYNKAARGASYRYDNGHIINLTIANMGVMTDADFDKYADTQFQLSMLGRPEQKIYEVLLHELLHMQQFLRYSNGMPTNQKWKQFSKSYEDAGGADGMGSDYYVFDDNASEMETFALQIAIELRDSVGKAEALHMLNRRNRDTRKIMMHSSSLRTFEENDVDLQRPELSTLLDRARQYLKSIR